MRTWTETGVGALIVLGWVLTARWGLGISRRLTELGERVSWLEAKVNGRDR